MENSELINQIKKIKKKSNEWLNNLEDRKKEELDFHNLDRELEDKEILHKQKELNIHSNKKIYSIVKPSREYKDKWLAENVKNKVFLDYACGDGLIAIDCAKLGASLSIGIDISNVSIQNAKRNSINEKIDDKCYFAQSDCENTELPDESIDIILCHGVLHHLDLSYAFPELRRILKPGGKILCVEALSVNPIIQLYRDLTPNNRTDWEKKHILGPNDIKLAKYFFNVSDIKFWYLLSLLGIPFRKMFLFKFVIPFLRFFDLIILKIPLIKWLSWQFTFVLEKK